MLAGVLIGAVGTLLGSLLTLIFSKLYDAWRQKKEHGYHLNKVFAERRLEVAEATVAFWTKTRANCIQMNNILASLIDKSATDPFDERLRDAAQKLFNTSHTDTDVQMLARYYLYFEPTEEEITDTIEFSSRQHRAYLEAGSAAERYRRVLGAFEDMQDEEERLDVSAGLKEEWERVKDKVQILIEQNTHIINEANESIDRIFREIKEQYST